MAPEAETTAGMKRAFDDFYDKLDAATVPYPGGGRRVAGAPHAVLLSESGTGLEGWLSRCIREIDAAHGVSVEAIPGIEFQETDVLGGLWVPIPRADMKTRALPFGGTGADPTALAAWESAIRVVGFPVQKWNAMQAFNPGGPHQRWHAGDVITPEDLHILESARKLIRLIQPAPSTSPPPITLEPTRQEQRPTADRLRQQGEAAPKRHYTKDELETEIRRYRAKRGRKYKTILEAVRAGSQGARKAAQAMFGRNAIARALGCRSPRMVGESVPWKSIAAELDLPRKDHKAKKRVGLEMADEERSKAAGDPVAATVHNNELRERLERLGGAGRSVLNDLAAGKIAPDAAEQIAGMLEDPGAVD